MYPNMCPMMGMMPIPSYCMPTYYSSMMYPGMPMKKKCERKDEEDDVKKYVPSREESQTEEMYRSGYRCMRDEDETEDDRNPDQGMQMPQTSQMGPGFFGQMQPGMPGMMGTPGMPGPTMQGAPGMPMQQMMYPQQMLQMIERENPEIIRMMTSLGVPLITAQQLILSILQAAQTHMQMRSR